MPAETTLAASQLFTQIFLLFWLLATTTRLWLAQRQIVCVRQHRPAVPKQFVEHIALTDHQKAADYTIAKTRLGIAATLAEAALVMGLTLGGGLQDLHRWLSAFLHGWSYDLVLVFTVGLISAAVDLPFSLLRQFVVEQRFGFNRMTLALFVSDLLKQLLLTAAIGAPLLLAVLWLMGAMGERWWLYAWLLWTAFNLLLLFIYPIWIAPLFNKFQPLTDADLKSRIEALLARCGFRSSGLFVMDGSRRSAHGNAYFTGFGQAKRIVFFDTLIGRLSGDEIEAVLAHELGHFRHRHVLQRIALTFALSFAFLWLLAQLMQQPWFFSGLGVESAGTAMALILFFLALPVFTFPFAPLTSLLSRRHEYQADAYAATHANRDDMIRALVKLYADNAATLTPDRWHSAFYDSHPPAALRIAHLEHSGNCSA